jgi:hypothetical protein
LSLRSNPGLKLANAFGVDETFSENQDLANLQRRDADRDAEMSLHVRAEFTYAGMLSMLANSL